MTDAVTSGKRVRELQHLEMEKSGTLVRFFPDVDDGPFMYYMISYRKEENYQSNHKTYPRFENPEDELLFIECLFENMSLKPFDPTKSIQRYVNSIHSATVKYYELKKWSLDQNLP